MMSEKAKKRGRETQEKKREDLKASLWGEELSEMKIWQAAHEKGFTSIPRYLPHIGIIMDRLATKGKPISGVYNVLWARCFNSFLEIQNLEDLAYEAGFSGQRAVYTLQERLRCLEDLGFIKTKGRSNNKFRYILIIHPLWVVEELKEEVNKDDYQTLILRARDIGADMPKKH